MWMCVLIFEATEGLLFGLGAKDTEIITSVAQETCGF
jgi:hypothetical protein